MDCELCHAPIHAGQSVLLPCSCFVAVCQQCAKNELVQQPDTYESQLACPNCHCKYRPELGVQEALEEERSLIFDAFAEVNLEHSRPDLEITFTKLQICFNRLREKYEPGEKLDKREAPPKMNRELDLAIKKLRYDIGMMVLRYCPTHESKLPLDCIRFRRNLHLESLLRPEDDESTVDMSDSGCTLCYQPITVGQSALLTCACIVCRPCSIDNIMKSSTTYHISGSARTAAAAGAENAVLQSKKIRCPNPHCPESDATFTVRNARALMNAEQALLRSASAQFPLDRRSPADLLRCYWAMGYHGRVTETMLVPSPRLSDMQLHLEVAILEERRLNEVGLLTTLSAPRTGAEERWGFLSGADIAHNTILERLVLHLHTPVLQVTSSNSGSSSSYSSGTAGPTLAVDSLASRVALVLKNQKALTGLAACTMLDKLVLMALYIRRDPADVSTPYTFRTAEEVCAAVEVVVQRMAAVLGQEVMQKIRDKIAAETKSARILGRLRKKGLLIRYGAESDQHGDDDLLEDSDSEKETFRGWWRAVDFCHLQQQASHSAGRGREAFLRSQLGPTLYGVLEAAGLIEPPQDRVRVAQASTVVSPSVRSTAPSRPGATHLAVQTPDLPSKSQNLASVTRAVTATPPAAASIVGKRAGGSAGTQSASKRPRPGDGTSTAEGLAAAAAWDRHGLFSAVEGNGAEGIVRTADNAGGRDCGGFVFDGDAGGDYGFNDTTRNTASSTVAASDGAPLPTGPSAETHSTPGAGHPFLRACPSADADVPSTAKPLLSPGRRTQLAASVGCPVLRPSTTVATESSIPMLASQCALHPEDDSQSSSSSSSSSATAAAGLPQPLSTPTPIRTPTMPSPSASRSSAARTETQILKRTHTEMEATTPSNDLPAAQPLTAADLSSAARTDDTAELNELKRARKELREVNKRVLRYEIENQRLSGRNDTLSELNKQLQITLRDKTQECNALQVQLQQATEDGAKWKSAYDKRVQSCEEAKQAQLRASRELAGARQQHQELQAEVTRLRQLLLSSTATSSSRPTAQPQQVQRQPSPFVAEQQPHSAAQRPQQLSGPGKYGSARADAGKAKTGRSDHGSVSSSSSSNSLLHPSSGAGSGGGLNNGAAAGDKR